MFYISKNKLKMKLLEEHYKSLLEEYEKLTENFLSYKEQMELFKQFFNKHKEQILFIYSITNKFYAIILQNTFNDLIYGTDWNLCTFDLFSNNVICESEIKISNCSTNIISLDTYQCGRCGHASKQISAIKQISKNYACKNIHGRLFKETSIGFDNLIRFYEKNGFTVNNERDSFYMDL